MGVLLLVSALIFYYLAVLKFDYHKTRLLDLGWSDPSEYFAQAMTMRRGEFPYVNFGYEKLPSRYPVGYPALMVPWLRVLPQTESVLAPYRTNQAIGLFLVLLAFGFYSYIGLPLAGGFAALLLATLPAFFTSCRSPMSELSASAFITLAFIFAYLGLKEKHRWKIYVSAILLGISVNIRLQSAFFGPLLLAIALFPSQAKRVRWLLHCLLIPIVFLLAISPTLMLNAIEFHSPFKTGYHFWLATWPDHPPLFSPRYIPLNLTALWREFTLAPQRFSSANAYGTGTFVVPGFIILAGVGAFFIRFNRFVACALIAGFSYFALSISYIPVWLDLRFYLPVLMLLVALAVLPVMWAAKNLLVPKRTALALIFFALFVADCLGYPSRSIANAPTLGRFQAWQALHFARLPRYSQEFLAQQRLVQMFGAEPGLVLADINPVYLNAILPKGFVAVPLDQNRYTGFSAVTYDRAQEVALIKRSLAQSHGVYALFVSRQQMEEKAGRLPEIDGYKWVVADDASSEAVILKLNSST